MADKKGGLSALAKLKAGRRPVHRIEFPGTDQEVGLRLPTEADWEKARLAALKFLQAQGVNPDEGAGSTLYERDVLTRVLASCLIIPTDSNVQPPFCDGVEDLKRHTTTSERQTLIRELLDFTSEMDPDIDTPEGILAAGQLLEELEKKAPSEAAIRHVLRATEPAMLRRLLLSMVVQRSTSAGRRSSSSGD